MQMLRRSLLEAPERPAAGSTHGKRVELNAAGKVFDGGKGTSVEALAGVDLSIDPGEFVCVIGASGCGKSTLLRTVAGFETLTSGSVTVGGSPVAGPGPDRGVVFQDYGLFPWLSVADNIAYGPRRRGLDRSEIDIRVARYLELVGLSQFASKFPHELSGGMQQRVAIARVLANDAAVLLMDEPFGALDSLTRQTMQEELHSIWKEVSPTVIFVTHSVEEAVFLADRVVVMGGGPNHGTPGHIELVLEIGLEHPRDVTSAGFNDLRRRLLGVIHA